MAKERIGIMGGTFNPIHSGHIHLAKCARAQEKLDRVLFLPTGNPPHKHEGLASAEDRYRMVAAAICQEEGFEPSRLEVDRQGVIYTVDTLALLKEKYPRADLFYLIGTDTLLELQHWRDYEKVLGLCTFLICPRRGAVPREALAERKRLKKLGGRFIAIDMEPMDVSSTGMRAELVKGREPEDMPLQVAEYARIAGLYGTEGPLLRGREWLDLLWGALSTKRFSHTLAVASTARRLAHLHGIDAAQAETAGLLHDCAKCLPLSEMQRVSVSHALTGDAEILGSGNLLHSVAGAFLAAERYGVTDPDVLRAISCHTTGKVGMTDLDMAVYLADKIEPTRAPYPLLDKVRYAAQLSLPRAMLLSMEGTAKYVKKGGKPIHPTTLAVIDWLKRTFPENGGKPEPEETGA